MTRFVVKVNDIIGFIKTFRFDDYDSYVCGDIPKIRITDKKCNPLCITDIYNSVCSIIFDHNGKKDTVHIKKFDGTREPRLQLIFDSYTLKDTQKLKIVKNYKFLKVFKDEHPDSTLVVVIMVIAYNRKPKISIMEVK